MALLVGGSNEEAFMNTNEAQEKTNSLDTRLRRINRLMQKKEQKKPVRNKSEDETKVINIYRRADTA